MMVRLLRNIPVGGPSNFIQMNGKIFAIPWGTLRGGERGTVNFPVIKIFCLRPSVSDLYRTFTDGRCIDRYYIW